MNSPKKPNTAEFPPVCFPLTNCGFLHFEKWKFWGERSVGVNSSNFAIFWEKFPNFPYDKIEKNKTKIPAT
jgi:hypothetical protein